MVKIASRACGFHVLGAAQVPLLLCLPRRYSDATALELKKKKKKIF